MKTIVLIFTMAVLLTSCGSELDVPATYEYSSSTLLSWETYRYDENGNYANIPNDDAPAPDVSYYDTNGSQKTITLQEDGLAQIDDYGDVYSSSYEGSSPITISIDSQPTAFESVNDGASITARAISSGNFNPSAINNNILVSSMCGDFVNCQEIDPSEWLFTDGQTDEIVYIIVREETYVRQ